MKKILYTGLQLPWPLDNGQKIVCFNDLKYLSTQFEVDVISYIDPINLPHKDEYLDILRRKLVNVNFLEPVVHRILINNSLITKIRYYINGIIRGIPFVISKYRNAAYLQLIKDVYKAKNHDLIYIESLASCYVLDEIPELKHSNCKVIYRAYDIFYETVSRFSKELGLRPTGLAAKLDAVICRTYEHRVWSDVDFIFNVTQRLGEVMKTEVPGINADKIFYFPVFVEPLQTKVSIENKTQHVLYIGTIHYPPNLSGLQWFLKEAWPLVRARNPKAQLNIVGRGGEHLLPVDPSVKIYNYVDDIESLYEDASVFIVPLFSGSGIRLKILDALNHGVPVVSTHVGYEGLEVMEGRDILVADDPQPFADYISSLLNSFETQQKFAKNGQEFISNKHNPQLADAVLDDLMKRLVEKTDNKNR